MWILIIEWPLEYDFQPGKKYPLHGNGLSFVFDENCEAVWIYDLTYEIVEEGEDDE